MVQSVSIRKDKLLRDGKYNTVPESCNGFNLMHTRTRLYKKIENGENFVADDYVNFVCLAYNFPCRIEIVSENALLTMYRLMFCDNTDINNVKRLQFQYLVFSKEPDIACAYNPKFVLSFDLHSNNKIVMSMPTNPIF